MSAGEKERDPFQSDAWGPFLFTGEDGCNSNVSEREKDIIAEGKSLLRLGEHLPLWHTAETNLQKLINGWGCGALTLSTVYEKNLHRFERLGRNQAHSRVSWFVF